MLVLVVASGPDAGKEYTFDRGCVLGRSPDCDVYLRDLNVSRQHARIRPGEGGCWELEDLGSANGTSVNGVDVHRCELQNGDVIQIGGSSFFYRSQPEGYGEPAGRQDNSSSSVIEKVATRVENWAEVAASLQVRTGSAPQLEDVEGEVAQHDDEAIAAPEASHMLEAMYAVTDVIASEIDLQRVMTKVLDHLFEVFPQSERGFVMLVDPETNELVPEAIKQRESHSGGLNYSETIVASMLSLGDGVILGNPTAPAAPAAAQTPDSSSPRVPRIGAPLRLKDEILGTLHLEAGLSTKDYSATDLALLTAIARQVAMAIAHARASESLLARHRLEADLELAREIQRSFLPQKLPDVPGLSLGAFYSAALQVGGDFYDVVQLNESRIGVVVGDITGKGVSAALLMAKMTSEIRMLLQSLQRPGAVLSWANESLLAMEQETMFATVLCLVLDIATGTILLANAGHAPPVVSSPLRQLDEAAAVPLGFTGGVTYTEASYRLSPGEVCLLYTDGLSEAMNAAGEDFGTERLLSLVEICPPEPDELIKRLVNEIRRFSHGVTQSDDQTIVTLGLAPTARSARR